MTNAALNSIKKRHGTMRGPLARSNGRAPRHPEKRQNAAEAKSRARVISRLMGMADGLWKKFAQAQYRGLSNQQPSVNHDFNSAELNRSVYTGSSPYIAVL